MQIPSEWEFHFAWCDKMTVRMGWWLALGTCSLYLGFPSREGRKVETEQSALDHGDLKLEKFLHAACRVCDLRT